MLWGRLVEPLARSSLGRLGSYPSPLPVGLMTSRPYPVRHSAKSNHGPGNHEVGGKGHILKQAQTSFSQQNCQIQLGNLAQPFPLGPLFPIWGRLRQCLSAPKWPSLRGLDKVRNRTQPSHNPRLQVRMGRLYFCYRSFREKKTNKQANPKQTQQNPSIYQLKKGYVVHWETLILWDCPHLYLCIRSAFRWLRC